MAQVFSELFPVSLNVTVITFVVTFHTPRISLVRYLRFKIFWAPLLIMFISSESAVPVNRHVPLSLSFFITDYNIQFIFRNGSVSFHLLMP